MGLEKDLPSGEQLLTLFRPFLEYLAASDLSPKTIQKHVDNMWALGGEFIRDLHSDSSLRKKPVEQVLLQDDRVRGTTALSQRRRSAEIIRLHVQEVPPVPRRNGPLKLAATHKFPRRGCISDRPSGPTIDPVAASADRAPTGKTPRNTEASLE